MPLLFCYGSNHPAQLEDRVGRPKWTAAAFTRDYKRVFRGWSNGWGGGVASLVKSTKRTTFGYVAMVTEAQLRIMDDYEGVGVGAYARKMIPLVYIDPKKGQVATKAVAYIASSREFNPPSKKYLEAIAKTIGSFWEIAGIGDITIE